MSTDGTATKQEHLPSTSETASETETALRELEERLGPGLEEAADQLAKVGVRVTALIREHPGTALLCAAGVGFLIGKLASRR